MAELERAARVHARMLANQPDLTPPQGGPVHPLEDLPAAARWVDVEGQGELRLQGVLRRARHVLRRRLLRLQAGASAARRRAAPCETTPPLPTAAVALQAKYVFKDSKGSDAVGVELFNGTPGDAASLVGKLDIDLREFRKANASSDAWMRVRPRADVVSAAPDAAVPRAAPSPARPRRSSSASRAPSARSAAASPRRFRAAGSAPRTSKRNRFSPAAGRRRRAGELHGRPGPGGQGRAVHMPVVGAAALRAN
jgi:hypothetical protein